MARETIPTVSKKRQRRRSQSERSAATRGQILDATIRCIAEHGLSRSTLVFIARNAGVTSGAVQHHFRSRDELLLTVVEEFGNALAAESVHVRKPDGDEPIATRVRRIFQRYWPLFSSPNFAAVMKIWFGCQSNSPLYREILDKVRWFEIRFDRDWIDLFADCPSSPETIAAARHVALGAMRGLAMSSSYSIAPDRLALEVALLEQMLVSTLEGNADS